MYIQRVNDYRSSSYNNALDPALQVHPSGVSPPNKNEEFFKTQTGIIVAIVVGTILLILLLILITIVAVSYRRNSKSSQSSELAMYVLDSVLGMQWYTIVVCML